MLIYLEHPVHGRKIASIELEAIEDEKHDWTRYNPDDVPQVEPLEVKRKYTRRAVTEGN